MKSGNAIPNRMIVYVRDVMNITGRAERYCRNLMDQICHRFNKPKNSLVTIDEFCEFTGLKKEDVWQYLK
jgi:hypothetical protein